jgi:hypothetical protein
VTDLAMRAMAACTGSSPDPGVERLLDGLDV